MELIEGIETRRSIRAFKSTPVPRETIEKILRTASKSPSYTNTQPWEVAVVCGKKRDELSKILYNLANADTKPNPDMPSPSNWPPELERRTKEHGARRLQALGVQRDDAQTRKAQNLANYQFYGGPCALFLFVDSSLGPWSIYDT